MLLNSSLLPDKLFIRHDKKRGNPNLKSQKVDKSE